MFVIVLTQHAFFQAMHVHIRLSRIIEIERLFIGEKGVKHHIAENHFLFHTWIPKEDNDVALKK